MPKSNRNYPEAPPYREDRDPSPFNRNGLSTTDGGSAETPATAGKQPMKEIDADGV